MGEVYLAHDARLNRRVALKVLPADLISNRERLHRFEQEARAVSALNHQNILTIHEIGAEGDTYFIATEFIEGETLRRKLKADSLEIGETLNIATQIAAALDAAHRSGIVHRDIKPENVMVREDGLVKVLDFGLAKLTEKKTGDVDSEAATRAQVKTQAGMILGTIAYMSPEQARGQKVDARTDIFSLGVVLYEMLAGRLPFEGATPSDMIAAILTGKPAPLDKDTPAELQRIVRKSLQKKADERYQTAKDLLIDLKSLKHDLDFTAELERSGISTKSEQSEPTQESKHSTSSAQYIVSRIKRDKFARSAALATLVVALAVLGYFVFFAPRNQTPITSVAVLPFINESGNADNEYLSDGMTESLIGSLSQLPKLSVKARSSVFRYKGKDVSPQTVGKELSVQAVLLGRVMQRGDVLMLSLELVDARTENVIWSEQYNRRQTDLVSLQSEIARDVSNKLRVKLSGADEQKLAKNYTANTEAYQLYLKGRFYWNKRTPNDSWKSIEYFQQAVKVDPNYALGFAGLADAYSTIAVNSSDAPPRGMMLQAREAALKALSLDNNLAEAHTPLGLVLSADYDFAGSEREYKRAIELNPNYATAHFWYGMLLIRLGRQEESFAAFRRGLEIDPLSLVGNLFYGNSLFFARKYDESIEQTKKTLELDVNFSPAHLQLGLAYQLKGNYPESVEEYARFQELRGKPEDATLMRESFAKGGWQGFLRAMVGDRRPANLPWQLNTAILHAALGEKDKAFAELNREYENREFYLVLLKVDPRLDPLRDDPRFQDLLRRVGFMP